MTSIPGLYPNVLIVGSNSIIGSALTNRLSSVSQTCHSTINHTPFEKANTIFLDLSDESTFININRDYYSTAVLCAGVTSIRSCENSPLETRRVNVLGNIALIRYLAQAGVHIVYLSTSLVFDGSLQYPKASDPTNPCTEYARQKLMVEQYLLENVPSSTIIRFSKVLQPNHRLLQDWLCNLQSSSRIYPLAHKKLSPISLHTAVEIIIWLINHRKSGIYHASSSKELTYSELARQLAHIAGFDTSLISPTKELGIEDHHQPYTTLYTSEDISSLFGPLSAVSALPPVVDFFMKSKHISNPTH